MMKVTKTVLGLMFLWLANFACFAQAATLNSPTRNGNQFQFNLQGDPYRHYVIQGSSNLQQWASLATNVSPLAIRPMSFVASNRFTFYRSALFTRTNLVSKIIQTTGSFDSRGNNFSVDSFDSRDPFLSTDGQYDPQKATDHAELSLDEGLTNSLGVGNAAIFGSVATGPEAPLMLGDFGKIGDWAWMTDPNLSGLECGKHSIELNPYFPEANEPFTGGYSTSAQGWRITNEFVSRIHTSTTTTNYPSGPGVVSTNFILVVSTNPPNPSTVFGVVTTNLPSSPGPGCTDNPFYHQTNYVFRRVQSYTATQTVSMTNSFSETYDFIFDEGNYKMSDLSGKILVRGNARVIIADELQLIGGNDKITIETNASLELYVGAQSCYIGGQQIINRNNNPTNFIYYGLPGNTNVSFGGNASFAGIIYAPQARVTLGGGGTDTQDFIGAIVARSIILNGHFDFHYDEALREFLLHP
jgi:hypothetical protein